eukprot:5700247-Amphidinium_carterae.1
MQPQSIELQSVTNQSVVYPSLKRELLWNFGGNAAQGGHWDNFVLCRRMPLTLWIPISIQTCVDVIGSLQHDHT